MEKQNNQVHRNYDQENKSPWSVKSIQAGLLWHLLSSQTRKRISRYLTLDELKLLTEQFRRYKNLDQKKRKWVEQKVHKEASLSHHPMFYLLLLVLILLMGIAIIIHVYSIPDMPIFVRQQILTPLVLAMTAPLMIAWIPTYRRVALFRLPKDAEGFFLISLTMILLLWFLTLIAMEDSGTKFALSRSSFSILLIAGMLVPFLEEPVFRELIPSMFPEYASHLTGHIVSGVVFSLAHLPTSLSMFVLYLMSAFALSALRVRTGSLLPPMIAHSGANILILFVS